MQESKLVVIEMSKALDKLWVNTQDKFEKTIY